MNRQPLAFLSYVHSDDKHEEGRITQFRKRLSNEVQTQTGEEFPIFQDRKDIQWGQNWSERIEDSLDEVTFLIPIITPGFFRSAPCRKEMETFLEREKRLQRNDLILPLYYVDSPLLNDETKRAADRLAQIIASRQHADWRDLRFKSYTSPQLRRMLAQLALQIRDALERSVVSAAITQEGTPAVAVRIEAVSQTTQELGRPARKTEPPTRVVDLMHRGDDATISEAINAANPGDRILVRPGLYSEGLMMDKPLEIIGDGELGDVKVEANGKDALLFQTTMGRVVNMVLRQTGGGKWYGVDVVQGRLVLEGCDISSQTLACVAIHGGADPHLRRNRIHDGKQGGVYVYQNGQGTLEDNDIFDNALAGLAIKSGGNPTLRRNKIHDGKQVGVHVYENGQGTLEDNDIFGNALAGVEIKSGGNPTLRRNKIHDGKSGGVFVHEKGEGTLEENDIFGNPLAGVEIKSGGNPTLRRNKVHDGKTSGVYVHENGQGTLEDNDIFDNALSGVEIKEGGNPTLRRDRIHDCKQVGVYVYQNGQGTLEGNDILGNALAGVAIKSGGNPTVRRNKIHDGKSNGVHVHENGQGTVEDNEIFGNALAGIEIKTGGNPTLRRNRINKNGYEAVWVHEGGAGLIEDNDLRDNARGAWDVAKDCEPNVKRSRNLE